MSGASMQDAAQHGAAPGAPCGLPLRPRGVWEGVRDVFPLLLAVAPLSMVLGAKAQATGLSALEITMMTAFNFAGGSEFAALELWASPVPVLTIVLLTFLINSRHIIMGAALTKFIGHLPKRKALPALFFMNDEGWAVAYAQTVRDAAAGARAPFSLRYYLGACVAVYPVWVLSSTIGWFIGPALGDLTRYGFGMALPAVYLIIVRGMWPGTRAALPWLVSLVVAAACYLLVPGHAYVLAGTFAGLATAWWWGEVEA